MFRLLLRCQHILPSSAVRLWSSRHVQQLDVSNPLSIGANPHCGCDQHQTHDIISVFTFLLNLFSVTIKDTNCLIPGSMEEGSCEANGKFSFLWIAWFVIILTIARHWTISLTTPSHSIPLSSILIISCHQCSEPKSGVS